MTIAIVTITGLAMGQRANLYARSNGVKVLESTQADSEGVATITIERGYTAGYFLLITDTDGTSGLTASTEVVIPYDGCTFDYPTLRDAPRSGRFTADFDDGSASVMLVKDLAVELGVRPMCYLPTSLIGTDTVYDGDTMLSWADVAELAAAGFGIGSHSRSHVGLGGLTAGELKSEVAGSRDDLAARGYNAAWMSYPFGSADAAAYASVKRYYRLGRILSAETYNDLDPSEYETVAGWTFLESSGRGTLQARISEAVNVGGWLAACYHRIGTGATFWMPLDEIRAQWAWAISSGAEIPSIYPCGPPHGYVIGKAV